MWEWYFWYRSNLVVHAWCARMCTDMSLFALGIFSFLLYWLVLLVYTLPSLLVFGLSPLPLWAGFGLMVGGNLWVLTCWRVDIGVFPLPFSGFERGIQRRISWDFTQRDTSSSINSELLHPLGLHQWCIIYLIVLLLYLCMLCRLYSFSWVSSYYHLRLRARFISYVWDSVLVSLWWEFFVY